MKAQIFSRTRHQRSVGLWQQLSVRLLNNRMRNKEELARYRAFTLVVLSSDWFDAVVTRKMNLHSAFDVSAAAALLFLRFLSATERGKRTHAAARAGRAACLLFFFSSF